MATHGFTYKGTSGNTLTWHWDSGWAVESDIRWSTSSYIVPYAVDALLWKSCRQATIAKSRTEATHKASWNTCKEALCINRLDVEITNPCHGPETIHIDNNSAINLSRNLKHQHLTHHIAIKQPFMWNLIHKGQVKVRQVDSKENTDDIRPESLPQEAHEEHRTIMGLSLTV